MGREVEHLKGTHRDWVKNEVEGEREEYRQKGGEVEQENLTFV